MTVLVVGGTGQTGAAIAKGLQREGVSVRCTSTRGERGSVRFVWNETSTHDAALRGVRAAYFLAPPLDPSPERVICPFIERAKEAGVKRFVLLGASAIGEGEPGIGRVHTYLRERAPEWSVLRPSWFMQNFTNPAHFHARSVEAGEPIVTATRGGKVAFIDVLDIARVAVRLLVDENVRSTDYVLTGPEALSFDDVAAILGARIGRRVVHRSVHPAELHAHLLERGVPSAYATLLAALDEHIANGAEAHPTRTVEELTGVAPKSFAALVAGMRTERSAPEA